MSYLKETRPGGRCGLHGFFRRLSPDVNRLAVAVPAEVHSIAMSVDELQAAITHLSVEEIDRFSRWLDDYRADLWDRQIEDDILGGRLDALGKQANEDFESGRCTPLPLP